MRMIPDHIENISKRIDIMREIEILDLKSIMIEMKHLLSLVTQSCLTLFDPMDCSMSDFPVLNHLPEFAQIHAHVLAS